MTTQKFNSVRVRIAVGSVALVGAMGGRAFASSTTWQTTGQDWLTAANWSAGIPGLGDTATFSSSIPTSNTVNIGADTGVGAVVDNFTGSTGLTLNGPTTPITLTLSGQNVTVPQLVGGIVGSYSGANTILTNTSTTTGAKTLTLGSKINVALAGSTNNVVSSPTNAVTINGNISGTNAGMTFLGGGDASVNGATFKLAGTNTFTGGVTIGNTAGTQGGVLSVSAAANLPSTGNIVVNEQGQLLLNAAGGYGTAGQTLFLNGIGINKNSSGALRSFSNGSTTDVITWLGDISIGSALPIDATNGYVVISVTNPAGKALKVAGKLTGNGNLQKQGGAVLELAGTNNDATGATQIGNGTITVDAGSQLGAGDLDFFQTSSNTATLNLYNATQNIGSLSSHFTTVTNSGSASTSTQYLNLLGGGGTVLNLKQTQDTTFGYGAQPTLTSTISGNGSLVLGAGSTKTLTLTGPNTYTGTTTINAGTLNIANASTGSATGTGDVIVNSGGKLTSGGALVFGAGVTSGSLSGNLIVNSGGTVAPGGINAVGTLNVGGLTANGGSILNFDLIGGLSALSDRINASGALTLNGGTEVINVAGSKLASGTYQLINFSGGLANAGSQFSLGTTPGGRNRSYSLSMDATGVFLNIVNSGVERYWSVGGGNPTVDGGGSWSNGFTNFFATPNIASQAYDNSSNNDVIIGTGGNGGVIALGSNVRVGGALVFGSVNSPYTIGNVGGSNALTVAGGVIASNDAVVNAPVVLEASQTFSSSTGSTLTINGGISETGASRTLTKDDVGTLILGGTSTYTGGTVISAGTLQTTSSALPSTGGVTDNASLVFSQASSGTFSGLIGGTGSVTINNTTPSASLTLSNAANSYSGATIIQSGVLTASSGSGLGTGAGGIVLSGGTLRSAASLSFAATGSVASRKVTLVDGTTSTIDTSGGDIALNQNIGGSGNLTKAGAGNLTLAGLPSTTVIGSVAIQAGSITLAPPSNVPSFGFSASASDSSTWAGDLILAQPLELRLYGGNFSGGGAIRVKPTGLTITSRGATVIGNDIVLNDNATPLASYTVTLGTNLNNTLTVNGAIRGASDVSFSSGAGDYYLGGHSTYTGGTTIDNGVGYGVHIMTDNALPKTSIVHISSSGDLDLNDHTVTIAGLDGGSSGTAVVMNQGSGTATLAVTGAVSTTYTGILQDGQSGKLALLLDSANTGTLTLTNLNGNTSTYSGGTVINGGTLALAEPASILTNIPITTGTAGTFSILAGTRQFDVINGTGTTRVTAGATFAATSLTQGALANDGDVTLNTGSAGSIGGIGNLTLASGGQFSVGSIHQTNLTLAANTAFSLTHSSVLSGGTSKVASLAVDSTAKFDIADSALIVDYTGASPLSTIASLVKSGALSGKGITSSLATSNLTIGFAEATRLGGTHTSFAGEPLDSTAVVVVLTLKGDTNLDRTVNFADLVALAQNYNGTGKTWADGDFNYDNTVNFADLVSLAQNYNGTFVSAQTLTNLTGSAFAEDWSLAQSFVPEPTSLSVCLGALALMQRHRR